MWQVNEHREISKTCRKLPVQIIKKYELWKEIVYRHGPEKLSELPGFRDEQLGGELAGKRSSRLSLHYRVVYSVDREVVTVYVISITPHKY